MSEGEAEVHLRPLTGRIDWGRLARTDVDTIVADGDVSSLATHSQDVLYGAATARGAYVDPDFLKAVQVGQYAAQYIHQSQQALQDRIAALEDRLAKTQEQVKAAAEARRERDRQLYRMRKESRASDALIESYQIMLASINPELAAKTVVRYGELRMRKHRGKKPERVVLAEKQTQANTKTPAVDGVMEAKAAESPVPSPKPKPGFPVPSGPPPISASCHPPPGVAVHSPGGASLSSSWAGSPTHRAPLPGLENTIASRRGFADVTVSAVSDVVVDAASGRSVPGSTPPPQLLGAVTCSVNRLRLNAAQRPLWFPTTTPRTIVVSATATGDGLHELLWTSSDVEVPAGVDTVVVCQTFAVTADTMADLCVRAAGSDFSVSIAVGVKLRSGLKRLGAATVPAVDLASGAAHHEVAFVATGGGDLGTFELGL